MFGINIGSEITNLVGRLTGFVEDIVTTDEERKQLNNKIKQAAQQFKLDMEQQVTSRHQADMTSDSWLSKNIRPLSLIFTTSVVTVFAFGDGNLGFTIKPAYISLMKAIMMAQFTFYFGSRGLEKYQAIRASERLDIERARQGSRTESPRVEEAKKEIAEAKVTEKRDFPD